MNKVKYVIVLFIFIVGSCGTESRISIYSLPKRSTNSLTGSDFYKEVVVLDPEKREELIEKAFLSGNFPNFLRRFSPINVSIITENDEIIHATYYVMPDYLSVGNDRDFFRIPMQPKTAQKIADAFNCFLSTRKICDDIYKASKVKLAPTPLTENRNSVTIFYLHNQIIEKQRNGRKGLIAGIKKDVIISSAINRDIRPNRVAIYGWHKLDGKPIQPIYVGHVDWYVDYSHGIRLVYRKIVVNGNEMDYTDVLKDPVLSPILCDEDDCLYFSYPLN